MQRDPLLRKFRLGGPDSHAASSYKLIVGAAMVVFSGTFVFSASQMPIGTWSSLGTGAYPMALAWIGAATGVLAVAEGLTEKRAESGKGVVGAEQSDATTTPSAEHDAASAGAQRRRVWVSFAVLAVYFALLSTVGFIIASWLAAAAFMRLMRGTGVFVPLITGGIVTITLWLLFEIALSMPLP